MTAAAPPRHELTSPELMARIEDRIQSAGNTVGTAMVELTRGVSDEDILESLHEAMNALTIAMLDMAHLKETS